jgi:Arc/MetJ-type ribon-helix-helix transcriptional regulator
MPVAPSGSTSQINFRADNETKAALEALTKDGTSVSEVIRRAIKDARWAALKAEAIAQAKRDSEDPAQIAIMEQVRRDMDSISAW